MITENDKNQILKTGVIEGSFRLASGIETTQKFDFDLINGDELAICIDGLVQLIETWFPTAKCIVTIANGATRLGDPIAEVLGMQHIKTAHSSGKPRVFRLLGNVVGPAVIVDDVFTRGTTIGQLSALIAEQTGVDPLGAVTVLNRSPIPIPTVSLASGQTLPIKSVIHYYMED